VIAETPVNFTGKTVMATTINGSLPGPTLRMREGDTVTIRVTNKLREATSIHWHGIILPFQMDGVPGISFAGIQPGETFTYRFTLEQSGTYWYHSHSGFQELTGVYGGLIIEPREGETIRADRDYVMLLSDWMDGDPMQVFPSSRYRATNTISIGLRLPIFSRRFTRRHEIRHRKAQDVERDAHESDRSCGFVGGSTDLSS
jgi:FtsP/CotA-like multicopper oxidase with cupredoxin domain